MKLPGNPPMPVRVERMRHAAMLLRRNAGIPRYDRWSHERISRATGAELTDIADLASNTVKVERGRLVYNGGNAA